MRIPLVAGNWKMNQTVDEARILVSEMAPRLGRIKGVEMVICPPFTSLLTLAAMLQGTGIHLGAQNMHWEERGAFTGEVAPGMVAEYCSHVILGHSERRCMFDESDVKVNRKVHAALNHDLTPILCVGETLEENEAGQTVQVVHRQVVDGLVGMVAATASRIVIAYEPVWAIGTGRASSGEKANEVVHEIIRPALGELFSRDVSEMIRVLYGGSVTAANAGEFFSQPDIDGALVGGASLKASEFAEIVRTAAKKGAAS